jgi:perosamine synthetase
MFEQIVSFIRKLYGDESPIPLHAPVFLGREKYFLNECIDSMYVSTVGPFVAEFENQIAAFTGAKYAISTVNGTAALHAALLVAGVKPGDEVITQNLTFVATANAIAYCGAEPVILDINEQNLGLSADQLHSFLTEHCSEKAGKLVNRKTGRRIAACVPMHVFGHAVEIAKIQSLCQEYGVPLIEDAAEALGSTWSGKHLGTFGMMGVLSFNGNKTITTGGGGMILTNDEGIAKRAKHLTTTARLPHAWEFIHDEVGYNYRLPNLNAALGCAQIENLEQIVANKRETARQYGDFFAKMKIPFLLESAKCHSNYWLNAIFLKDQSERDEFLQFAVDKGIMARPAWPLISELPAFRHCQSLSQDVAKSVRARMVNLPSSYRSAL